MGARTLPRHARPSAVERGQAELLRHARPLAVGRWVGRNADRGPEGPQADAEAAQPDARRDPLQDPLAVTEHCFIGDQIRLPAACCDIPGCGAEFADLAALGEADNRARALAAGWSADAFGQLVCPACQQRRSRTRRQLPLPEPDTDGYPAPAAVPPWPRQGWYQATPPRLPKGRNPATPPGPRGGWLLVLRAWIAEWRTAASAMSPGPHHPGQWLRVLAALASGANGWRDPRPFTGPGRKPTDLH